MDAPQGREYFYISTRNNNHSNRGHHGSIVVLNDLTTAEIVGIVIAVVAVGAGASAFAIWKYKSGSSSAAGGGSSV